MNRRLLGALLLELAQLVVTTHVAVCKAAQAAARRKVIIDQDAFGPATSNLQAILMVLQAQDVEILGITVTSPFVPPPPRPARRLPHAHGA